MKNNLFLYNVIKKMTMNEKRYFKIFCSRHTNDANNKYVFLFTVLNNLKSFNEATFQKKLVNKEYTFPFLSSDLKYLKKILLKALNDFNLDKTINLSVKQQLITIEILFYKGLYEECLALIKKAKNGHQTILNHYVYLELLNWEKKCMGYSSGLLSALEINKELHFLIDELNQGKIITDFYYQSYYFKNSIGKIPTEEIRKGFDEIFNHEIFKKPYKISLLQLQIYYFLIYANYHHTLDDDQSELIYLNKTLEIYESNPIFRAENPLDYVAIYFRLIEILKQGNSGVFNEALQKIKNFDAIIDMQKTVVKERIYLFTLQAELEHLIIQNNDTTHINEVLTEIVNNINQATYKIEPYYYIKFYYLIASVLCNINNFSAGLKFVNKILNEYKFNDRPTIFVKTEFLNIVIHYELKNYEMVLQHIKNYNKKYGAFYIFNPIEKNILQVLIKIANNPHIVTEKKEFTALKNKIDKSEIDFTKTINKSYYNYIVTKT